MSGHHIMEYERPVVLTAHMYITTPQGELAKVEEALAKSSPLVFAGECRQLHEHLGTYPRGSGRGIVLLIMVSTPPSFWGLVQYSRILQYTLSPVQPRPPWASASS